jgi:hypothetical protein
VLINTLCPVLKTGIRSFSRRRASRQRSFGLWWKKFCARQSLRAAEARMQR